MKRLPWHFDFNWWRAVGTMIGGVVGVGVFGLPYAFMKSGWSFGLLMLLILSCFLLLLNLMYTEVILQTQGRHRLVGYIKKYLGVNASHLVTVTFVPYAWGALLAYLIVGGDFLYTLLSPFFGGPIIIYQIIIALFSAILTFGGIKKLAKLESIIVCALLFLFVFIILLALPSLEWRNVSALHFNNWFMPYGVLFFALFGMGVIPEMKEILGQREKKELPSAVLTGQVVILCIYALFTLAVVGITGPLTTPAAFDGLANVFGRTFAVAGSILGVITIISISSIVSIELQDVCRFDYRLSQKVSWFIAAFVPLVLLLLGFNKFIDLIGFLGAIFGGFTGILVVIMYQKMRRSGLCETHHCLRVPAFIPWLLIAVFSSGIVFTFLKI